MSKSTEVKKSTCMGCHIHCRVEGHVVNGRLVKIEEDKAFPKAEAVRPIVRACPRARAFPDYVYHPDRLNFPLKRSGDRGGGQWKQISWQEALDEIAARLSDTKREYGAEAIATSVGTARTHDEYRMRFFNLLGSPNNLGQGQICYGPGSVLSRAIYGWPDFYPAIGRTTRCVVILGANPEQAARGLWHALLSAQKGGAKLIVVDPRYTSTAERADIWLQLRPGTDCALYLGMINIIIREDLYDRAFVNRWCYGFGELTERVKEYDLDKVAEITCVPAEKIREAAETYARMKPGVIVHTMGVEQLGLNSIEAMHARYILTAITGNIDVRGGEEMRGHHPLLVPQYDIELNEKLSPEQQAKQLGSDKFGLLSKSGEALISRYAKTKMGTTHTTFAHAPTVFRAMLTGRPYPVKALITAASNPLVTQPNTRLVYEAIKALDLHVVQDFWMTPSAELADYVLPAATWLERSGIFNYDDSVDFIYASEPVIPSRMEGEYDHRTDYDLWRGLGVRLDQQEFWPWETLEEALAYRLQPLGFDSVADFLHKNGGILISPKRERKYEETGFGTRTGKVELYSTVLEELGYDPLPKYQEPAESPVSTPELAKDYPLTLITGGRVQPYYHSEWRQVDAARKTHPYPVVQINPATAADLGIRDGDWVWIETPVGRIRQKCQFYQGILPHVVNAEHGWWYPELPGQEPVLHGVWESNINVVVNDEPRYCSSISGGWTLRGLLCRVYKANSL